MIYMSCNAGLWPLTQYKLPPLLDSFLAYWASQMVEGAPPVRDRNFSPGAMRRWLGHLALIEKFGDSDLRFRLAGTYLQARFGAELTRKRFSEVEIEILGDLGDRVNRAMHLVTPVAKVVSMPLKRMEFYDLILPLANPDGVIDLVVFASAPVSADMG